jgi:hypothetical protein
VGFLKVQDMDMKRMLRGSWFVRLVLAIWIVCAVSIIVLFRNMELIVHGELYYYGLVFDPAWAEPYRLFTWLIYLCLGLPMVLSGIALISSFFNVEEAEQKETAVIRKATTRMGVIKRESRQVTEDPIRVQTVNELAKEVEIAKETPESIEGVEESPVLAQNVKSVTNGTSCPHCKKIFSRALVMLDFRGGKNRLVSVCPYCNYVLGTSGQTGLAEDVVTPMADDKIERR